MFKLKGKVKIHPTEDKEKVRIAVENIFGNIKLSFLSEENFEVLIFTSNQEDSLSKFKRIVKQNMIRDAVRSHLKGCIKNGKIVFYLNKQVAYAGHVSLCEPEGESPLGPIEVEVECGDPDRLIEWLTAKETGKT
jgi:predicted RNA binding protein with dsRBD fold (UPF0201 family)